jgi:hypothetical protein
MMRSVCLRPLLLLALLAAFPFAAPLAQEGAEAKGRPPVPQGSLKQGNSAGQRSVQSDCVREANRRGFSVLDTGNYQQFREGWSVDMRVRDMRGRSFSGSCFVETRSGDVNLYGFGWGYDDAGDDRMTFNCASTDRKYRECQLPVDGRLRLVKQISDSPCIEGRTWGRRGDRVWVDEGCRAKFEVQRRGGGGGGGSSGNTIRCESDANRYRECPIGPGYFGRLVHDNSGGRCRQGSTWGTRNGVIWVTSGCRGVFEKQRGNSGNSGSNGNGNSGSGSGGGFGGGGSGAAGAARLACENEARSRDYNVRETAQPRQTQYGYEVLMQARKNGNDRTLVCRYDRNGSVSIDRL